MAPELRHLFSPLRVGSLTLKNRIFSSGHAEWEVRVELPDHDATDRLADLLEEQDVAVVRRARYVLVGAVNEDQARALAERIRREAPEGARIEVEPGGDVVWEVMPRNPFAVFGGLGL